MPPLDQSAVKQHPAFIELVRKRRRLRLVITGLMLLVFLGYLISWAYFPQLVNLRYPTGSAVSLGIWFTVIVVLAAIILSAYYSIIAGRKFDELNDQLISDVHHDA